MSLKGHRDDEPAGHSGSADDLSARLSAALERCAPLIRSMAGRKGAGRNAHRDWEDLALYEGRGQPYTVMAELDGLARECLGAERAMFGGAIMGGSIEHHYIRIALAERLVAGVEAEVVARDMLDLCGSRRADVLCVYGLAGVEPEDVIPLSSQADLRPIAAVPPSSKRETFFNLNSDGGSRHTMTPRPSAAVVFTRPGIEVLRSFDQPGVPPGAAEQIALVEKVVSACALAGATATTFVAAYDHIAHPAVGYEGLGDGGSFAGMLPPFIRPQPVTNATLSPWLEKLEALDGGVWKPIKFALSRYARSARALEPADKALDLGIALETTLLHNEGGKGANNEIRYKVGVRGAWFLGRDAEHRLQLFEDLRALYDARSGAAHDGVVQKKHLGAIDIGFEHVIEIIRRIVEAGKFPEWNRVALGLAPEPALEPSDAASASPTLGSAPH